MSGRSAMPPHRAHRAPRRRARTIWLTLAVLAGAAAQWPGEGAVVAQEAPPPAPPAREPAAADGLSGDGAANEAQPASAPRTRQPLVPSDSPPTYDTPRPGGAGWRAAPVAGLSGSDPIVRALAMESAGLLAEAQKSWRAASRAASPSN